MPHLVTHCGVDTNIFTSNQASGGTGGSNVSFIKLDKGAIMTKIQAWKEKWRIRGVEMWMSDATSKLIGSRSGSTEVFELAIGENVTKLNVQASGEPSSGGYYRLGAIYLETDRGRSFGIYSDNLKEDGRYWPSVGSGLVCGMFGSGGDDVDNLGFALLQPVKQARLVDVTYPNLDMEVVANTPETVASEYYTNETSVNQSYTLTGKKTVTTKREWSTSTAFESSMETSVTAGVPTVESAGVTASWTVGTTTEQSRSVTETEERGWSWPIICPAHTKILATGTMYSDNIDTEYKATMKIDLVNGYDYSYSVQGIYEGLNARNGVLKIEDLGPA